MTSSSRAYHVRDERGISEAMHGTRTVTGVTQQVANTSVSVPATAVLSADAMTVTLTSSAPLASGAGVAAGDAGGFHPLHIGATSGKISVTTGGGTGVSSSYFWVPTAARN
ncbi:hypothetical protein GMSM_40460 [Geomonas sp. Red276]